MHLDEFEHACCVVVVDDDLSLFTLYSHLDGLVLEPESVEREDGFLCVHRVFELDEAIAQTLALNRKTQK